jgi:rod shape-determining protein MreB
VLANERELLVRSIVKAGASSVVVIPEPLAAAIGAGVDVSSSYARMVIDFGEGVFDCAVIQSSKIRLTRAVRSGCARLRKEIVAAAARRGDRAITDETAELILRTCGVALSGSDPTAANMSAWAAAAIEAPLQDMLDSVDSFLRDLPPSLGCEIIDNGILLTGGGALIPGIRERLEERTGINVRTASRPLFSVVEGARNILPVVTALNQWGQRA